MSSIVLGSVFANHLRQHANLQPDNANEGHSMNRQDESHNDFCEFNDEDAVSSAEQPLPEIESYAENGNDSRSRVQFLLGQIQAPPLLLFPFMENGNRERPSHEQYCLRLAEANTQLLQALDPLVLYIQSSSMAIQKILPYQSTDITKGIRKCIASILTDTIRSLMTIFQSSRNNILPSHNILESHESLLLAARPKSHYF